MAPENNTDSGQTNIPINGGPIKSTSDITPPTTPSVDNSGISPSSDSAPVETTTTAPISSNPDSGSSAPISTPTSAPTEVPSSTTPDVPTKAKKPHGKMMVTFVVILLLFVGGVAGAYLYGKHGQKVVTVAPAVQPISLPPQAIVTSACTVGRGKQYIIPKDIPQGPIYDVKNSKVIAIEYVLGVKALLSNPDTFSSTLLLLAKGYNVDHFTVVPVAPQPGDTDQFIHLIMFVVTKAEANSITCGQTTPTTPSTTPITIPTTPTTTTTTTTPTTTKTTTTTPVTTTKP